MDRKYKRIWESIKIYKMHIYFKIYFIDESQENRFRSLENIIKGNISRLKIYELSPKLLIALI